MLTVLQSVYGLFGILFNLINILVIKLDSMPLSPTPPWLGLSVLSLYSLSLVTALRRDKTLYRRLSLAFVLVLGLYPVIFNLAHYSQMSSLYLSPVSFWSGTGINFFGLVVNTLAGLHWYKDDYAASDS